MKISHTTHIKILIGITVLALLFHFLILFKIIPYEIAWGGKLKTDEDMYRFETVSIAINTFFIYTLLQKGHLVRCVFNTKTVSIILWIFFIVFILNTLGNLLADTLFERTFTLVTLLNAYLLFKINRR